MKPPRAPDERNGARVTTARLWPRGRPAWLSAVKTKSLLRSAAVLALAAMLAAFAWNGVDHLPASPGAAMKTAPSRDLVTVGLAHVPFAAPLLLQWVALFRES